MQIRSAVLPAPGRKYGCCYRGFIAGISILLCACSAGDDPDLPPPEPVVVYAGYEDATYLRRLFEEYTKASGVQVILRNGAAEAMVDDLIENTIEPPADLLLTPTVIGVERAAYDGALRPVLLPDIADSVGARLRGPDGAWLPLSFRRATIVFNLELVAVVDVADFDDLAAEGLRGRLCLVSSANPLSRAVIAMMIEEKGVRDAEIMVRGWVGNLARPVFDNELGLLAAIDSGECGIGVVSDRAAGSRQSIAPQTPVLDIEGLGIGRHARNPGGAAALIEWLLSDAIQTQHAAASGASAATSRVDGSKNVSLVARYAEDAALLAERARYH